MILELTCSVENCMSKKLVRAKTLQLKIVIVLMT